MPNKWINLDDLKKLSATTKPYTRTDYGDAVDRRRHTSKQVGRHYRFLRDKDRARDRDQEREPDRDNDEQDIDRPDDR